MLALIPLFPLIGFLINGCLYLFWQIPSDRAHRHESHQALHPKKISSEVAGMIATACIFLSFVVSAIVFCQLTSSDEAHRSVELILYPWFTVGQLHLDMALRIDVLSTLFTLVITGVGTLIHLYSMGYMHHDPSPAKFFAYLNLFCFAMLMLVMGSSLPIVFLGWEGVGLCSYLLIGYWYSDLMKAKAGKKAFIVNRVGDMGFLIGIFLTFHTFGTLDFEALRTAVSLGGHDSTLITAICLLLFVGCAGKSAQIPLYVWLPDAMAGPTPVSALIHAATMVTSGIYLLARLNFLYNLAPVALHFVATVGVATAFFAATIAVAQKDIKKVLAYSTVSQLGYMFLACGVGAYSAAVFHVITHAFFKALLFLGAGSVIHGVHEEQNIWKMGGLREKMPKTFFTFLIGWLAISGIPPFSGFFSKDEILWQAYSSASGSVGLWLVGLITAAMTAFYMTRLFVLTFLGEPRMGEVAKRSDHHQADSHPAKHPSVHESPATMVVPLQILAGMSLVVGLIGIPHRSWLEKWLEPVISSHLGAHLEVAEIGRSVAPQMEWILMGVSTVVAVLSIRFGWLAYRNLDLIQVWTKRFQSLHGILENKWYVDEIYERMIVRPIYVLSEFLWKGLDIGLIDRIVLSFGQASEWTGERLRVVQSGSIQVYALVFLFGLVVTAGYLVYVWI